MFKLKLSKRTYSLIENFSRINKSMWVRSGNVLRTVPKDKDIFGVAQVEEQFPTEFGISDLPKFLSVLDLYDNPELAIDEKRLVFRGTNNKQFAMTLAHEKAISPQLPDNWESTAPFPDPITQFELPAVDLVALKKNVTAGDLTEFGFICDGEKITARAMRKSDSTSDQYSDVIGEGNSKFDIFFVVRKLNVMQEHTYKVTVMPNIVRFQTENLSYWLAPEIGSVYE